MKLIDAAVAVDNSGPLRMLSCNGPQPFRRARPIAVDRLSADFDESCPICGRAARSS